VRKPDEIEYDQSRWLDALQRGSLLHKIFCRFMQELRERKESPFLKVHGPLIKSIAEDLIARTKEEIPPPSGGIFAREKQELMDSLQVFLKAEEGREKPVKPVLFEAAFGMKTEKGEGMEEPAVIGIDKDHSLQLRGKIDRIDRLRENLYRVVDYKTGSYSMYDNLESFGRGRILQHALYSLAAEQILEKLGLEEVALVVQSGYYFPTRRGEGKEVLVEGVDRRKLRQLLMELMGILAVGNFIVNPDVRCDYCDFMPVCPAGAPSNAKAKQEANPDEFSIFERLKDYE
jgi:ATP-dependent helicase/nuclease subunit B